MPVYLRADLVELHTRGEWCRRGRAVKAGDADAAVSMTWESLKGFQGSFKGAGVDIRQWQV